MASASLIPKNGAVAFGSLVADFQSFSLRAEQSVENVTPYGANKMTKNVGNGTPDYTINIGAFALKGATSTDPGLDDAATNMAATGVSATLTLDTSVTYTGTIVASSIEFQHSRLRAAVPLAISGKNYGDFTEAWVTS